MRLNNKGFTLVELLAVVVILSVLMAIMVPSISYLIEENKEKSYTNLEKNIISAAKAYLSDNRYNITLNSGGSLCGAGESEEKIDKIGGDSLISSKLPIKLLIDRKYLSADSNGNIENPKEDGKKLDLDYDAADSEYSYVLVKYQCSTKDYIYTLDKVEKGATEESLKWVEY